MVAGGSPSVAPVMPRQRNTAMVCGRDADPMISRIACFLVASLAPFAAPVARAAAPASTAPAFASVVPIASLHAHNDYQHARPLAEALANGFASVEADVCLVGGQLLVGHKVEECVPGR